MGYHEVGGWEVVKLGERLGCRDVGGWKVGRLEGGWKFGRVEIGRLGDSEVEREIGRHGAAP